METFAKVHCCTTHSGEVILFDHTWWWRGQDFKVQEKKRLLMLRTVSGSNLIQCNSRWLKDSEKVYRQTIQTVHNSSKKAARKKGGGKHLKAQPYNKCMHILKQEGEFCWSTPMVKVHFRWMCASNGGCKKWSLMPTNTFSPSGLWNNKKKCASLWSFVAC